MFKKYLLIFVSLFIVHAYNIAAQQSYSDILPSGKTAIFKESFDSNNNKWVLDNLWLKGNVVNGYYDIVCKNYQKSTGLSYKSILIDQKKDYEIEASVNTLKGSGGLAFGITSKYEHYRIDISYNNTLVILKNTPSKGMNKKLFSGYVNSSIKAGSFNKITIRKLKDIFYIFLNEVLIGRFNKIKPEGDQIGFNVGLNSEISVDYLNISYLTSQTAPIMAERNPTPPLITWISPSGLTTTLDTYTARIRASIKSGSELKSVLLYVNGASKGEGEIKSSPGDIGTYIIEKTILLKPGENNVYLVATNFEGESKSDLRYFIIPIIVVGEASGMVMIDRDREKLGLAGMIINFYTKDQKKAGQILTKEDGHFNYFGLATGAFSARIDTEQLRRLSMISSPDSINFNITANIEGYFADGLDFIVKIKTREPVVTLEQKVSGKDSKYMIINEVIPGVITSATKNYAIQLGAFKLKAYADTFRKKFAALLDKEVEIFFENGFYKVRITGFWSIKEVNDYVPLLKRNDVNVMWVITLK